VCTKTPAFRVFWYTVAQSPVGLGFVILLALFDLVRRNAESGSYKCPSFVANSLLPCQSIGRDHASFRGRCQHRCLLKSTAPSDCPFEE
jgi:hypothetical protein